MQAKQINCENPKNKPLIKLKRPIRHTYQIGKKQAVVVAFYNNNHGKPITDILTNMMITDIEKDSEKP